MESFKDMLDFEMIHVQPQLIYEMRVVRFIDNHHCMQ